jgi:hypothetical protein
MRIARSVFVLAGLMFSIIVPQDKASLADSKTPPATIVRNAKRQNQSEGTAGSYAQGRWRGTTLEGDSLEFHIKGRQLSGPLVLDFLVAGISCSSGQSDIIDKSRTRIKVNIPGAELAKGGAFSITLPRWDMSITVSGAIYKSSAKGIIEFAANDCVAKHAWVGKPSESSSHAEIRSFPGMGAPVLDHRRSTR